MSKHLIKIDNPHHCAMSVAHAGKDNQYCESGEVVAIYWQPSSGWGLQEAHYTDEDGNKYVVGPMQSISFPPNEGRGLVNASDKPAKMLVIINYPQA